MKILAPQKGPQEQFAASKADIVFYGGAAGGGKSFSLLLEPLRHIEKPLFNALILRHSYTQLSAPGGLWETSQEVYGEIQGAMPVITPKYHWNFQSGATIYFAHISTDLDVRQWHGSQIALIGFDEVTDFTEYQFFYMLSRNRSSSGVRPYMRATCNPDPDSWVARFIEWWIDQDTGYAIPERSGAIRWMVRLDGIIHWFDTTEEAEQFLKDSGVDEDEARHMYKSVTFIASKLTDNPALMKMDPGYIANLNALPLVEREQLLNGNWKIRNKAGLMFKRSQVIMVDSDMIDYANITKYVRAWDLAATSETERGDPAYTAGVLMGEYKDKRYVILDVINQRVSAGEVENLVLNTAIADKAKYGRVKNRVPQDPGSAGKMVAKQFIKLLATKGFAIEARLESGDKVQRASPVSAMWEHGFIQVMVAPWNDMYFTEMESFPEGKFKDMVDATSSAFDELVNYSAFNYRNMV